MERIPRDPMSAMPIERQVCSLELSRRLKELGANQDSHFWWVKKIFANDPPVDPWIILDCVDAHALENISAFTTSELGEMLPHFVNGLPPIFAFKGHTAIVRDEAGRKLHQIDADTEADARCAMLIYLLENKLLSPGEVSKR